MHRQISGMVHVNHGCAISAKRFIFSVGEPIRPPLNNARFESKRRKIHLRGTGAADELKPARAGLMVF
jgi:hypothetical protein